MSHVSVEQLHRALGGEISRGKNGPQVVCPGPGHSGADRSLAVSPAANNDGFIVHSFSPADDPITCKDYVRDKVGLPPFRPGNGHSRPQRPITKEYDYSDETGQLLFQAVRYEPKGFAQRRPDGHGGWIWKLDDVRRVPYRLPELIETLANDRPVFVVEGEKDVDALWAIGVPATCNPQGAGKWRDEYSEHFRGATVYVIPDNDQPGRDHADEVHRSLTTMGAAARIVTLPGLPDKGDVSDWLKAGGEVEDSTILPLGRRPKPMTVPACRSRSLNPANSLSRTLSRLTTSLMDCCKRRSCIRLLGQPAPAKPPSPFGWRQAWR